MNLSEIIDRARDRFSPRREFPSPPPAEGTVQGQAPIAIVLPGQQSRKVSMPVIVLGICVACAGLYFAGHSSAHVDSPATARPNDPTPTSASNIKDFNKPVTPPAPMKTPEQLANEAYQAQQVAAMQAGFNGAQSPFAPGQAAPRVLHRVNRR